jgi:hypothetical protein
VINREQETAMYDQPDGDEMSTEDPRIERLREEIEIDVDDGLPNSMSSISAIQYLLAAYDVALEGYESWKVEGQKMHAALLEIWHSAEPGDTKHMTFGLDPSTVVESVRTALALADDQRRKIDAVERLMAVKSHDDGIPSYYNERLRAALTTAPRQPRRREP